MDHETVAHSNRDRDRDRDRGVKVRVIKKERWREVIDTETRQS